LKLGGSFYTEMGVEFNQPTRCNQVLRSKRGKKGVELPSSKLKKLAQ